MELEEIERRSRFGPLILVARRLFSVLVGFGSTVIISRILPPSAFGLAAMATVVFTLANIFKDFGLTSAMMRKGHVTQDEMSFLFWTNTIITGIASVIILIMAPIIASFFHETLVTPIIYIGVLSFAAGGLSLQHNALLSRNLQFVQISSIDTCAQVIGLITSITLALIRHDVWAIVIGNLAQAIVGSAATMIVSRWKPGPPKYIAEMGDLLRFGVNSTVYSISVFASTNAPVVVLGYLVGSSKLGQYTRANALYSLPATALIEPITQAMLPVLAMYRRFPEKYKQTYLMLVRLLSLLLMPCSVMMFFAAPSAVAVVLGAKWSLAGLALRALAPAFFGVGLAYAIGDLFITQNRSAEMRNLGLFEAAMRITAIWIGGRYGLVGVAYGVSISTLMLVPTRLYTISRSGPISAMDQLRAALPGAAIALAAALAILPALILIHQFAAPPLIEALAILCSGMAGSAAAGLLSPSTRNAVRDFIPMLSSKASGKREVAST